MTDKPTTFVPEMDALINHAQQIKARYADYNGAIEMGDRLWTIVLDLLEAAHRELLDASAPDRQRGSAVGRVNRNTAIVVTTAAFDKLLETAARIELACDGDMEFTPTKIENHKKGIHGRLDGPCALKNH